MDHQLKYQPSRSTLVPGEKSFALWQMAQSGRSILYLASGDEDFLRISANLKFLGIHHPVHIFEPWDCPPYERTSPSHSLMQRRLQTMHELSDDKDPVIVLTTIAALMQRLPPISHIPKQKLLLNDSVRRKLLSYLPDQGFERQGVVTSSGEYAVRGSIIDIADGEDGIRLDFFGEKLEAIRSFSLETQCSNGSLVEYTIYPCTEVDLTDAGRKGFVRNYLHRFGQQDDPLLSAVAEGRKYPGLEQLLPLFWPQLETLISYLPADTSFITDVNIDLYTQGVWDKIEHAFEQRQQYGGASRHAMTPEELYLRPDILKDLLAPFPQLHASPLRAAPLFLLQAKAHNGSVYEHLQQFISACGKPLVIACNSFGSCERLGKTLREHDIKVQMLEDWHQCLHLPIGVVGLIVFFLQRGVILPQLVMVSEQDILGPRQASSKRNRPRLTSCTDLNSILVNDYVVHTDHGIGVFDGLETLTVQSVEHDFIKLLYADGDKLYLPVENFELISRYSSSGTVVALDKLGAGAWQRRKSQLKKRIRLAAEQLLSIAAARKLQTAIPLHPIGELYQKFCSNFPYLETEDQMRAIEETLADLEKETPADRMICGDVGFGKTEVAMRATAAAVFSENPVQVMLIVPTTLLARQHYQSFCQRFADLPVQLVQLSKFVGRAQAASNKSMIEEGKADIIIGTHALLAKDIKFKNLGLIIIDEEQHFGVKQKEYLKSLKTNAHIVTLSATPIPRTLNMSLSGIKDLSMIMTSPIDRLPIHTHVGQFDGPLLREAILREHNRGGRVFYVTPRIQYIAEAVRRLESIAPEITVGIANGQMNASALDRVMNQFYDGHFTVLISTNIIESGLDINSANTIIIDRPEMFGTAQLYQMRGRVGRGKVQAYAYLIPQRVLSTDSRKRLEILQSLNYGGAGLMIATHDMETRGHGNLMGEEQSGHIREVGLELYHSMLAEAVASLVGNKEQEDDAWSPILNVGVSVRLPDDYINDSTLKLSVYKQLAQLKDSADLEQLTIELIDRFGPLPLEAEHLLMVLKLKQMAKTKQIRKIDCSESGVLLSFHKDQPQSMERVLAFARSHEAKIRPDNRLLIKCNWGNSEMRLNGLYNILQML